MSETSEVSSDRTGRSRIDDTYLVETQCRVTCRDPCIQGKVQELTSKGLSSLINYAIKTNNNSRAKYFEGRDITDEPVKIHMKCQQDAYSVNTSYNCT